MARIYLVRHGRAAAGWDADADPGLDETGRREAQAIAASLASLGPLRLLTSPLRRARETAAAFERIWQLEAEIEPRLSEIPSPRMDLAARGDWLRKVMAGTWPAQPAELRAWRGRLGDALREMTEDTVVATHFVAINVAVGLATGRPELTLFHPANGSCTVIETGGEGLRLVRLGQEAESRVL
ncbi:MAG: histidine phosphatase family protein [Alphaproteobacteria bacterium]|nr:histidine phosphatase family protein [Alphaproteobacteria bacterium]